MDAPDADVLRALEEAATRIDLSGEGVSEILRLTAADLGQEDTRLAEGRGGHRYRVRTALVAHLPDRLFAFRSKEVARFDAREARSVELDFGSGVRVRVDRPNADVGWTDAEGRAGTEELTGLLDALATLDATDIVAEALGAEEQRVLGVAPPALAISVRGEVGLLAEIHVGPPDAAGVLVKAHPGEAVHRLAPSFGERLPATAAEFEGDFLTVSAAP